MLVLLTRPHGKALRTAAALEAHGHQTLLSPVLDIVATGARWPVGVIDAIVATSAQAFEHLALETEWPLPEVRRLMPLFLVGASTGAAAAACGLSGPARIAPNAAALAQIVASAAAPPCRLLYLAGHDRKPDLEATIKAAGATLDVRETYEARAAVLLGDDARAALGAGEIGAVLHYSRRSAAIFLELSEQADLDIAHVPHICISADAAAPLLEAAYPLVLVAEHPDEATMLGLVAAVGLGAA